MDHINSGVRLVNKDVQDRLKSLARSVDTTPNMLINMLIINCDSETIKKWDYKALDKRWRKTEKSE